jgi:hypothetical protein
MVTNAHGATHESEVFKAEHVSLIDWSVISFGIQILASLMMLSIEPHLHVGL